MTTEEPAEDTTTNKATIPLYQQIASKLRERIDQGEFTTAKNPKGRLPSERKLADEAEVSVETIRQARNVLVAEGKITVRHGAGMFVNTFQRIIRNENRRLSAAQWGQGHAITSADIGIRPLDILELTVEHQEAPAWIAERLAATHVVVRDRVYAVEKRRVQIATAYLDAGLVAGSPIEQEDTGAGGTFARLKELGHEPVLYLERKTFRTASPAEAKRLQVGRDALVVQIIRDAKDANGKIVEVSFLVLDADAYEFHSETPA